MRKLLLTLFLVARVLFLNAQQAPVKINTSDTFPKPDSVIIEELKDNVLDNLPVISLDDNDLSDVSAQNISSLLTAGRDPFLNAATFNFSALRFRIRGYSADYTGTYINGISMDNLDNGYTAYGLWGGLNDVFHNRDITIGVRYNTYAFGDIGNTTNIDVRASRQRPQSSIGYAYSNRSYDHRITLTHSTGLNKNGWAFTFSGSRRYAGEGYVAGTYFNGWSWFGAIDKKLGHRQILSLIAFGAPTESGRQGAATQEMIEIAGSHYYNPYWGYQNGKKRNASISKTDQPVIILTHDFRISNKTD
ncbi:MAG: Plug domain-containing protein, partial [Parafilimonas sp.]